jgi:hypothetical protein
MVARKYREYLDGKPGAEVTVEVYEPPASVVIFRYRAKAPAITGDPGPGFVRWTNVTQIASTTLAIDNMDQDGLDIQLGLAGLVPGDRLLLQDHDNSANYQHWVVNGSPVNAGGWWNVPVALVSSTGTGKTNFANGTALALRTVRAGPPAPPIAPGPQTLPALPEAEG